LAVLTHNVITALKRMALPESYLTARPKRLRFLIFKHRGPHPAPRAPPTVPHRWPRLARLDAPHALAHRLSFTAINKLAPILQPGANLRLDKRDASIFSAHSRSSRLTVLPSPSDPAFHSSEAPISRTPAP
jgi:hypothetical protein